MWLTRVSVDNPVFATMMMVALLVLGLFSYNRLGVDQFPSIDFPLVVVSTSYPGASPEAVEADVTRKIEEAVNTVAGIRKLTSKSYEGRSVVLIEFELTVNSQAAVNDVREKLSAIAGQFRTEVKTPEITRFNPDEAPILSFSVASKQRTPRDITTITDQIIVKQLQNVRGVGRVTIAGGVKRQIQIRLNPERLAAFNIGVDTVLNAVKIENQDLPAGTVTQFGGDRVVQIEGRLRKPEDFRSLVVARRGGALIPLEEIAEVVDGAEEEESLALLDGRRAVAVEVVKVQDANTIEVVDRLYAQLAEIKKGLPPDIVIDIVRDSSRGIRNSVANVRQTLIEGGVLTIVIVLIFLASWRSTVITGLTLPIAVMGTFVALFFAGFTLNMMTLMALSLAIGILIDDAIVVRENITRHHEMGKSHRQAALDGTNEIGLAVLATTFTIVAVFLPVAFMGGIVGRFFLQFGLTVAVAVLISLFVSFTLDPMLSSVWPEPETKRKPGGFVDRFMQGHEAVHQWMGRVYGAIIGWSLRHRIITMVAAIAIFVGSFMLVPRIGVEFVPAADLSEMIVEITGPVGSSLDYTGAKVAQVQKALAEFPEIAYSFGTINAGMAQGKNVGSIYVRLIDIKKRTRSPETLTQPIRERLERIPGLTLNIGVPGAVGFQKPIQVSILGRDIATLDQISQEYMAMARTVPGVVDLDSSLKAAKPILSVRLNRELANDLGIGLGQVVQTLRPLLAGEAASTWRDEAGDNYDVLVRLGRDDRTSKGDLERLYVTSGQAGTDGQPKLVQLAEIARFDEGTGASQINRRDLTREVLVGANTFGRPAGDIGRDLQARSAAIKLPPGYQIIYGGSTKDIAETAYFAGLAMSLAVILIYLILASQFGSFLQPIAIMVSLPLSLIGVFLGLLIAGTTLNIFSVIGFIMLMGLVTKNAILLVDFFNQQRHAGAGRDEAILEAGIIRLRPILMTTLAMIFGMLPLALGIGEGARQRAPMAHAVIGGLISSTLLTLIVVPVIISYIDDLTSWMKRRFGRRHGHAPAAGDD